MSKPIVTGHAQRLQGQIEELELMVERAEREREALLARARALALTPEEAQHLLGLLTGTDRSVCVVCRAIAPKLTRIAETEYDQTID